MKHFDNRIAAITGAGSGIGRALALQLAEHGAILALADIDEPGLEQTRARAEELGARVSVHRVDVSRREQVEAYAAEVEAQHGGCQLLFNNAGVSLVDTIETMDIEEMEWLMGINFWGVVYGTKAFLPLMRRAEEAHLINISSIFGIIGFPTQGIYNASKFAVRGYTEAMRIELAGTSVGVSCVHPGGIRTQIVANAKIAEENVQQTRQNFNQQFEKLARTSAEDAAAIILKGVLAKKVRILVGGDARFMDIVARLFPSRYEVLLRLNKMIGR
ncbi:SDR family NAD(P)-dependent oxidoreductase [Aestuariirhabdus sp. Z084]|uniref:SDR family NAD(P)-dependent oxidoreductase n=1 Tax=Aestuariirhabdus haliotis TaxID=2918751 RepID=UPI00201B3943|nr:SDR family NAD(P)-dependent oxidoreductase [Aestuariirhabdus haliotis]MCL6416521.1 SDR family NAD(P)-dependent oxidoreductase [Aestuariirhabdus haliotis]MCL6420511.1 SDR family NAD(P)-dependent oxidoreductase [Aestuariirhabdus haliotis]